MSQINMSQNGMSQNGGGDDPWGSGDRGSGSGGSGGGRNGGRGGSGGGDRGGGGGGGGRPEDDLERALRQMQERLRRFLQRGRGGKKGRRWSGASFLLVLGGILVIWAMSGIYRVQADEQGVVLRFGKFYKQTIPGLNYHLPWPIETAHTPKVTIVNRTDIGMRELRSRRGTAVRDVPEESLMLTGDENIVDVDFSVFWVISDAAGYLFNIQNPEATVKAVAESTMREIVGQNEIQPILTEQRQRNEESVKQLMQETLDHYKAGIAITQVKMQKVDPPAAVIDAFRDVQAARADQERARNEAQAYANRVVPEAQGEVVQIVRGAEAYRAQTVAEAEGDASRFVAIYNEYRIAKDVTRQRMFLETLERVLGEVPKVVIDKDAGGVLPYLPLNQLQERGAPRAPAPAANNNDEDDS